MPHPVVERSAALFTSSGVSDAAVHLPVPAQSLASSGVSHHAVERSAALFTSSGVSDATIHLSPSTTTSCSSRRRKRKSAPILIPSCIPSGDDINRLVNDLHLTSASNLDHLRQRYPSLCDITSWADVVTVARQYYHSDAVATASAHALQAFADGHPRIDVRTIADDLTRAHAVGIRDFITERSAAIADVSYQPVPRLPHDPCPDIPSVPPRPTTEQLENFHALAYGGPIFPPDGFVPNNVPSRAPREREYALAIEYLHQKDHALGLSVILPLDEARQLFNNAGLPFHDIDHFIVPATGKPQGRLVVNVSSAGLNDLLKKMFLAEFYSPIQYITHMDICQLFLDLEQHWPGQPLTIRVSDFDRWFKRIRLLVDQVGLFTQVIDIEGQQFAVIPLVGQFGCQESNYQSNAGSAYFHALTRIDDTLHYGRPVHLLYSDDGISFLPDVPEICIADSARYAARAEALAGTGTVNLLKDRTGPRQVLLGALYDTVHRTIGLAETLFLKLVCVFFLDIPLVLNTNVALPMRLYQRVGSYMYLASQFLPTLRPFRQGVYHNISGRINPRRPIRLTMRSVVDIMHWRTVLCYTMVSTAWLDNDIITPTLLRPWPFEDSIRLAARQRAQAHLIIGTDAARDDFDPHWGGGWLAHDQRHNQSVPLLIAWGDIYELKFLAYEQSGVQADTINFYEMLTAVVALDTTLTLVLSRMADRPAHLIIHIETDNSSALSWLTRYRSAHPCHQFLLQVFANLQSKHRCTVTVSHLPGVLNVIPDCISRRFLTENGSVIRASLPDHLRHQHLPTWWQTLVHSANTQSANRWLIAAAALTQLL